MGGGHSFFIGFAFLEFTVMKRVKYLQRAYLQLAENRFYSIIEKKQAVQPSHTALYYRYSITARRIFHVKQVTVVKSRSIKQEVKRVFLFISISFVFLCLLINWSIKQILISNANEYTTITAQKLTNQLDNVFDKMSTFSMSIVREQSVQNLMSGSFAEKSSLIKPVEEMLTHYKILDPTIVDFSLVNDEIHYSTLYTDSMLDQLSLKSSDHTFKWIGFQKPDMKSQENKPAMLLFGAKILEDGQSVGTIIITVNPSYFQISKETDLHAYYLLADKNKLIYSFNCPENTAENIMTLWREKSKTGTSIRNGSYYIQWAYSEKMDCYQIYATLIKSIQINRNMQRLQALTWSSVLLVILFMLLIFEIITRNVVNPLNHFYQAIQQIRSKHQRHLDQELQLKGCSEIQEIGKEFNDMLFDIDQLNRKIFENTINLYELKVQKQEAELLYLKSQVDPHFLYNTLEMIREKALEKDSTELAQMASDMGNIFRYSSKGDSTVKLEDEISIVKSYLRIQKNRFKGKIEVFFSLQEKTLKLPVPKMLLQPIVENAIFHGLEPKTQTGSLFIGARMEEDSLVFVVKDDGVGMPSEKLRKIRKELEAEQWDTSKHVGILNTQARIRLMYGEPFGLTIDSREGDGTTVKIKIPAAIKGREDGNV